MLFYDYFNNIFFSGPEHWGNTNSECVGKHQSPINIWTRNVQHKTYPQLKFEDFDKPLGEVILKNNGHTGNIGKLFPNINQVFPRKTRISREINSQILYQRRVCTVYQ